MLAWIEGWIVGNGYAPPYEEELDNLAMIIGEGMAVARIGPTNGKLFIGGDFNRDVKEKHLSAPYQMMRAQGGEVIEMDEPTRWNAGKEIDWVCSGRNELITERGTVKEHYSDHKMLKYEVHTKGVGGRTIGELVPKPRFEQPKIYTTEMWKKQLEEAMEDFEEEIEELEKN